MPLKPLPNILFLLFLLYDYTGLKAQFTLAERHEIQMNLNLREEFELVELKEKGILLIKVEDSWAYKKEKEFTFTFLDTTLTILKTQKLNVPFLFSQSHNTFYDENKFLYFFSQNELDRSIYIFRIDLNNNFSDYFEAKLPVKLTIQNFKAVNETAYMTGELDRKSVALSYNFLEKQVRVIPSFFTENEEVKGIFPDFQHNQMNFIVSNSERGKCKLYIKSHSNLIGLLDRSELEPRDKQTPKEAIIYPLENKDNLIFGTYSLSCLDMPQGVYAAKMKAGRQDKIYYYKFVEFGNFFNRYRSKRAEKLEKKVAKTREKGKEYLLSNRLVSQGKVLEKGDELILTVEGYYKNFKNNTPNSIANVNAIRYNYYNNYYNNYNYFNNLSASNSTNQASYRFTYALVCGFSRQGSLLWDNVIKIEDIEQSHLNPVLRVGYDKDSLILAYLKEDKIYSKMTHTYQTVKPEKYQDIVKLCADFLVADDLGSNLIHWYGNTFLLFGEQLLRSSNTETAFGRKVFHLSKINYYPQKEQEISKKEVKENHEK